MTKQILRVLFSLYRYFNLSKQHFGKYEKVSHAKAEKLSVLSPASMNKESGLLAHCWKSTC